MWRTHTATHPGISLAHPAQVCPSHKQVIKMTDTNNEKTTMNAEEGKWFMTMVQDMLETLDPKWSVGRVLRQVKRLNAELSGDNSND